MNNLRLVRVDEATPSMALATSQICAEATCQALFALPETQCPKCGSEGLSVQRLLDGRPDYSPLVAAAKDLLLLGSSLSVRQRRRLLDALHTAGVTL